ncbi:MAG: hypothetical protein AB1665_02835 [Candidatus Thermoplasmatota archaeon]
MCAQFNEGAAEALASYFGPVGIEDATVTSAYAGGWIYLIGTNVDWAANRRIDLILYDYYGGGFVAAEIACYPLGGAASSLVHWPGGTGTDTGVDVSAGAWHELYVQYFEATQTYTIWLDNAAIGAGSAFTDAAATNVDGLIWYGGDGGSLPANAYIDNFFHWVPPSGGLENVEVVNTWSYSGTIGNQSVYLDQNAGATQAYTEVAFPPPYGWNVSGVSFAVNTSTVANTNGATFWVKDFAGTSVMGIRFSGGNIQYYTGGAWVNMQAFAATTEYWIDVVMDAVTQLYYGVYIDGVEVPGTPGAALGQPGAGIAGFRAEGTTGTQSEIYFDDVGMFGDPQDARIRVNNSFAHTGVQSVRMYEGGAGTYSYFGAYMGGDNVKFGEFSFWFRPEPPMGNGQVYLYDTTQTYLVTIVSLGADIGGGPTPGQVQWVDGNGAGGGFIIPGPTYTTGAWYNVSIRYNITDGRYEALWNGVSQGWYGILESAAPDAGVVIFFGDAPNYPQNFYYDDVMLWIDDPPAPPTMAWVELPPPGEMWANYTTDLDIFDHGTVTGTEANTHGAGTEDIQEVSTGVWQIIFSETFSGTTDANWLGDDGGETAPSDEWWFVAEDPADTADIMVGVYNTPPSTNDIEFTDCDQLWTGQYAEARYNGANNWFALTSYTAGYINFSMTGGGMDANEGWRLEVTTNGGGSWTTVIEELAAAANHGWQTYSYALTAADLASTQFSFRVNVACNLANSEYADFDDFTVNVYGTANSLEHRWRTQPILGLASSLTLYVTARTNTGSDDSFTIGYAQSAGGPYTPTGITVNSDIMNTYSAALPTTLSGQLYLNVVDSNASDTASLDTVYVDEIRIEYYTAGPVWTNYTTAADNPDHGTVTGTEANTHGAGVQTVQEVWVLGSTTTLFSDDVEGGDLGYTTGQDAGASNWAIRTLSANSGVNSWDFGNGNYADPAAGGLSWLISPQINIPAGEASAQLTFFHWRDFEDDVDLWDGGNVKISTSGTGGPWTQLSGAPAYDGPAQAGYDNPLAGQQVWGHSTVGWVQVTIDLTAYIGQSIWIRWDAGVDNYATADAGWRIDDIVVTSTSLDRYSLEHRWTTQALPAGAEWLRLYVTGNYNTGSNDSFPIGYSTVLGGPYTYVITINSDVSTEYTATLPLSLATGAPIYLNVVDSNGADATGQDTVTIDEIRIEWRTGTDAIVHWTLSADDGAGANDVAGYEIYYSDQELGGGLFAPHNLLGTVGAGTSQYRHIGEAVDLVWNNWYYVYAFDNYRTLSTRPTGNCTKFNLPPATSNVMANGVGWPGIVISPGTPTVALAADLYDDTSTWEDIPKLDGAEWYDTTDPGEGLGNAMTGGPWDSVNEHVTATIDTSTWAAGSSHLICVRGHEAGPGNTGTGWGAIQSVWINVSAWESFMINVSSASDGWIMISTPLVPSDTSLPTALTDLDGNTTWDRVLWYDATAPTGAKWKQYYTAWNSSLNDLTNVDHTMGVWIHIVNPGDGFIRVQGTDPPSTNISLYAGWNLIGYPATNDSTYNVSALKAATGAIYVEGFSGAATYKTVVLADTYILKKGEAYWVYVPADTIWTVNW